MKTRVLMVLVCALLALSLGAQPGGSAGRGISLATTIPALTAGAGTITTDGTTNILGVGTTFTDLRVGRWLTIDGEPTRLRIMGITDNTHLTVGNAATTSASGSAWSWSDCAYGPALAKYTNATTVLYQCSDGLYAVIPLTGGGGGGSGTVTTVSVASSNGFAGTVANATTTPALTLRTTVTGMIKGNGTAISAATSGTDYAPGTSALATGILKSTTTTGGLTIAVAGDFPTLNQPTTSTAGGLTGSALGGDVTNSGNTVTLATVNPNVGSFGSATAAPTFTVDGKGRLTAAGSNTITPAESSVTFTDIATGNASTTAHGYLPKLSGSTSTFLRSDGSQAAVTGSNLSLSDVTTNDVGSTAHGFMPKLGADDTIPISNGTVYQNKAIVDCTDTGGNHLNYTAGTNSISCGTSGGSSGANAALSNLSSVAINATLATGAGTTLALTATAPAQTSAPQAGVPVNITASAAVDGSSTHTAATGGNIVLSPGATVNSGTRGKVSVQGLSNTGATAFDVLPSTGTSYARIFDNGSAAFNGDGSTASNILTLTTNGSSLATFTFNAINFFQPFNAGGGNFTVSTSGDGTCRDCSARHFLGSGTSPTVAGSCGTSPAIAGKDSFMKVTTGTGAPTSCTVTFGTAFTNAPSCVANASATTTPLNIATTTTTVTISSTALTAGEVLHIQCGSF
jgi:ethanolamine utilization microcompartment shell protein EutS